MTRHINFIDKILGFIRQPVLMIIMSLFIAIVLVLDNQASATPPSKMAELLFKIDMNCSSAKEATDIVFKNKDEILEKLGQKFQTITVRFKAGNPAKPFEGSVVDKTAGLNEVEFLFTYMSVSEYLSNKVIFPLMNRVYLCSVPMVLKEHSCLVTKEGKVLLNYYPVFEAVAKNKTEYGTVIYSDFTAYVSGSPALHFWFWIDNQGNIYTLPK
ncbi:MAG: hypothetical protein GY699_09940 [Desulfobacteraceae bacterium]|nr:hypothetical protein [Desulfobacteraceae bacterium]